MDSIAARPLAHPRLYKRDAPRRIDRIIEFFGEPAFPGVPASAERRGWSAGEPADLHGAAMRREA